VAQSTSAAQVSAPVVLHRISEGQNSALPALLLIHGCLEDAGKLAPLAEQFSAQRQVILADLPGHASSPVIDDLTAFGMACAIRSALEDDGLSGDQSWDLVGHSLGAAVAIELAKLLSGVNQVVLIEPTVEPRLLWPVREMLRQQYKSAATDERRSFIAQLCSKNFDYDIESERFLPVTSFDWSAQIAALGKPIHILVGDYQIPADPGCRNFPYLPSFFPAACYPEFSSIADLRIIQNAGHLLVYPQAPGYEQALLQIQDLLSPQDPITPVSPATSAMAVDAMAVGEQVTPVGEQTSSTSELDPTARESPMPAPKAMADLYVDTIVANEQARMLNQLIQSGFWWIDSIGEISLAVRSILASRWGYPHGISGDPLTSSWLLSASTPAAVASQWIGDRQWQDLRTVGLVVHPLHWFLRMYQRWGGGTSHGQFIDILASEMSKPKEQRPIHEAFLTQHDRLSHQGQITVSLWLREEELQSNLHRCPALSLEDRDQLPRLSSDLDGIGLEGNGLDDEVVQKIRDLYALDYSTFGFKAG